MFFESKKGRDHPFIYRGHSKGTERTVLYAGYAPPAWEE